MINCKIIKVYSNIIPLSIDIPYSNNYSLLDIIEKYIQILNNCKLSKNVEVYNMQDVINYEYDFSKIDYIDIYEDLDLLKCGIYIEIKNDKIE